jgi:outer membrane protein assembly factor BamA
MLGFDSDVGFLLGMGAQRTGYGFRQYPWASRLTATFALGSATQRPLAALEADLPLAGPLRTQLGVSYEGAELTRFYGLGNRTETPRPQGFYEARRETLRMRAGLAWRGREQLTASLGPVHTAVLGAETAATLLAELDPYGVGDFQTLALEASLGWDGRDDPLLPTRGVRVSGTARVVPALLDAVEVYGSVAATVSGHFSAAGALRPTLALRLGGEKLWGRYPWFDAATVGGAENLRGYRTGRYAGDASLFGTAELRLFLTDFVFLLPGELGVLALTDAGRVFLEGDTGGGWHNSAGGGLWASFVRSWVMSLAVAGGGDGTTVHFGVGMPF